MRIFLFLFFIAINNVSAETYYVLDESMLTNHNYNPKYDYYPWAYKKESKQIQNNSITAENQKDQRLNYLRKKYVELAGKIASSAFNGKEYITAIAERNMVQQEINQITGVTVIREQRKPINCYSSGIGNTFTTCY